MRRCFVAAHPELEILDPQRPQINEGGNWFHFEELANAGSYFADPIVNTAPSFGAWHQLEIDLDIAGGRARIWLDGVLRTDGSTDFVAERTVGFGIYAFRGGGGESPARDPALHHQSQRPCLDRT